MDFLISVPTVALIGGAVLALVALLVLELVAVHRINRVMSPAMEYARAKAEEEAERILEAARENARSLIARAESSAALLAGERAKEDDAARRAHEDALRSARERFDASLEALRTDVSAAGEAARAALAASVASAGEAAKSDLKAASEEAVRTFAAELGKTLEQARASATRYRQAREAAVEEHIHELVAETTKLALARSLPEAASAELVQKALEEAKAAHAL